MAAYTLSLSNPVAGGPLSCGGVGGTSTGNGSKNRGKNFVSVAFARSGRRGDGVQGRVRRSFCASVYRRSSVVSLASSSSSSWVEEEDDVAGFEPQFDLPFEGSPEGSTKEGTSVDAMKEVMLRLSEEDLEEAAKKYNYEDELFAQIDFAQINAFTNKAFSGNPAAVCYLPYEKDENWLRLIAREFNLPATAFVVKRRASKKSKVSGGEGSPLPGVDEIGEGLKPVKRMIKPVENEFDIRWFAPNAELEICGHATLASAHMIFSSGLVEGDTIIFYSKKDTLRARKVAGYDEPEDREGGDQEEDEEELTTKEQSKVELGKGVVELDFPLSKVRQVDSGEAQIVLDSLGVVKAVWVGKTTIGDYLVEFPSSDHVLQLQPQYARMMSFGGRGGVIATARASDGSGFDFISRFFAPKLCATEDPVTGSAHVALGPYWAAKLGKDSLRAYQASPRGGELSVRVDSAADRVYLQGGAVLLMAGTLLNTFRR